MRFGSIFAAAALVAMVLSTPGSVATAAQGKEARLHGQYAFSTTRICVNNPPNDPLPNINANFAFSNRSVAKLTGVNSYDGAGNGSITGTTTSYNFSTTSPGQPVSVTEFTGTFNYEVSADGIVREFNYYVTFTITAGAASGNTGTVTGVENSRRIVQGNTALISLSDDPSTVETVTQTNLAGPFYRICKRNTTLFKM